METPPWIYVKVYILFIVRLCGWSKVTFSKQQGIIRATGTYDEIKKHIDINAIVAKQVEEEDKSGITPVHRTSYRRHSFSSFIPDKKDSITVLPTLADQQGRSVKDKARSSRRASMPHLEPTYFSDVSFEDNQEEIVMDSLNSAKETIAQGKVGFRTYGSYFAAGHGIFLFPLYILLACGFQIFMNASDWLLTNWEFQSDKSMTWYIFIGLTAAVIIFGSVSALTFFCMTSLASKNLHNRTFAVLLRAPVRFFDMNPVGQVLNRFSRDLGFIDDFLPRTMFFFFQFSIAFLGNTVLISISNPWTVLLTLPVAMAMIGIRQYSLPATRDLKRIDAVSRSPIYSQLSTTLVGLPVIRAFKMESTFIKEFCHHQDNQSSAWYLFQTVHRWIGFRMDWLLTLYIAGYLLAVFLSPQFGNGGVVGLSLSYITTMLGAVQYIIRISAETESFMTSTERILEYTKLEVEDSGCKSDFHPPPDWPSRGSIEFKNVCLAYDEDAGNVLKNINFSIKDKEKIGIVGRTGAGKSSLITCLMRLSQPTGKIIIDEFDVLNIALHDIRSIISIIPQDPVLFTGTLRYNLDPFSEYSDDHLWQAIGQVQLTDKVRSMEGELYGEMSEEGSNLSVGQRQLVCLARAILRNKKILLIDEATANVDPHTDELIQKALKTNFTDSTVLCIAHRLNTIIDSDKVMVLDEGTVVEFDQPHILLQNHGSRLHHMVSQTGPQTAQQLHLLAENAYEKCKFKQGRTNEDSLKDITSLSPGNVNLAFVSDVAE